MKAVLTASPGTESKAHRDASTGAPDVCPGDPARRRIIIEKVAGEQNRHR